MNLTQGTLHVFTYKDGLLARLAHDLRLRLERFELKADGTKLSATFYADSLTVEGTVRQGQLDPNELSAKDKDKIRENMREEVLHTDRHPTATFQGQATERGAGRWSVQGELTLVGKTAPVTFDARLDGGRYVGELELTPSRWGIPPFKALGGAIKLQDKLKVAFAFDAPKA